MILNFEKNLIKIWTEIQILIENWSEKQLRNEKHWK